MNAKEELEFYKKQIKNNPELENAIIFGCDFEFDDETDVEKYILVCNGKSNYEIYPFGKNGCGSNFVILNNKYIGFTSSEGECGIIANNIKDFFNILAVCKNFQDYFKKGIFDSFENFNSKFTEVNNDYNDYLMEYGDYPYVNLIQAMEKFIKDNNFETETHILYEKFKSAIIMDPTFKIQCSDSNNSWFWDDLFGTEQNYIKELRRK